MKFIIIPSYILNDKNVTSTDKLLLGVINSLSIKQHYCYASNSYLAKVLNVSKRTITNSISNLKEQSFIKIDYLENERRIYLIKESIENFSRGIEEYCQPSVEIDFYHKKEYGIDNKINIPKWLDNPTLCQKKKLQKVKRKN